MTSQKIHTYAASFGDDLAYGLITENTLENDIVLDPFTGSSTTLVQAKILGRSGIGVDVDPIACLIAEVVTEKYTLVELDEFSNYIISSLNKVKNDAIRILVQNDTLSAKSHVILGTEIIIIPSNKEIDYWFLPIQKAVLGALIKLADSIKTKKFQDIILLTISASIIHKWPNTISLAKDIDHSRPHKTTRNNISVDSQVEIFQRNFKHSISSLRNIVNNTPQIETIFSIIHNDINKALPTLSSNSIDYVLTSPPYFNAIDYPRAHKFSEWWLWPDNNSINNTLYIGLKPGKE